MKLKYIIFLQNVDNSITELKLTHDLRVVSLDMDSTIKLIRNFDNCSISDAGRKLAIDSKVFNFDTDNNYFIEREFDAELDEQDIIDGNAGILNVLGSYQNEITPYLESMLTALRLFKEGDIAYWDEYFYRQNKSGKLLSSHSPKSKINFSLKYSINPDEIDQCNTFINGFIPPESKYLKLALEQFSNSYIAVDVESAFLCLMISLEALYLKSSRKVSFRLRRNCAIVLGNDSESSDVILHDIKELYIKRSNLIHGSRKAGKITRDDLYKCRYYVRESIKKFIELNEDHDTFLDKLESLKFGQISEVNNHGTNP